MRLLPLLATSLTLAAGLTVGTTAIAKDLTVADVGLDKHVAQLEHIIASLDIMQIQIEAGNIDQRMALRHKQWEDASYTALYLSFLAESTPGMTFTSDDNSIKAESIVAALEKFKLKLEEADKADAARLTELEKQLPEGYALNTPLLEESGKQAYAALKKIVEEQDNAD